MARFVQLTENPNASPEVTFFYRTAQEHQRSGPCPEGQIYLKAGGAEAAPRDPGLVRTVHRTAEIDGQKQVVVRKQRVKPWWKTDPSGHIVMSIKFGAKPIEFEKGKAGIVVPSKDKLPTVINTLIEAVRAGELDDLFAQASKQRPGLTNAETGWVGWLTRFLAPPERLVKVLEKVSPG
jgi:hypothetical protein